MSNEEAKMALAAEVARMAADGWRVESHSDYVAVMVEAKNTPGQAFARGGAIGMAWNARKSNKAKRVTLSVSGSGQIKRDYARA